jgi:hypothetical protein
MYWTLIFCATAPTGAIALCTTAGKLHDPRLRSRHQSASPFFFAVPSELKLREPSPLIFDALLSGQRHQSDGMFA